MPTIKGHWGRAQGGYLLHFWIYGARALCGQTHPTQLTDSAWLIRTRLRCKRCQKKHAALLAERGEASSQATKREETQGEKL